MVVLGGWAVTYERGTPVSLAPHSDTHRHYALLKGPAPFKVF